MLYRLFTALSILLFISTFAFSQGFVVTGSYPADGQAGLPTDPISILFRFGFSKPVNLNMVWPEGNIPLGPFNFLALDPLDSIELGLPYSSPSADTVGIFAKLRPATDYCVILYGAYSQDGELLNKPYVVNFTTNASTGTRKVSGTIVPPSGKISSFRFNSPLINLKDLKLKLPDEFGGKEISPTVLRKFENPNFSFKNFELSQPLKISSVDPNIGVVALLDGNPLANQDVNAKYAANVNSDFSFEVKYVRDGSYYLFVAFDTQRDGVFEFDIDLLMFYDADGDDWPDSINVSGGDLTGLNVSGVFQIRPFTVREKLDTVMALARSYASDAVLREINAPEMPVEVAQDTLDGKVYFANYGFYSASKDTPFAIYVNAFGEIELWSPAWLSGTANLPDTFVDNDVVFDSAEANGGFSFRSEPNTITSIFYELRNYPGDEGAPDTVNPYWRLSYVKSDTLYNPVGFLIFYLNPSDGRLVKKFEILFRPVTAKEKFRDVDSVAKIYASDAQLMYVVGGEIDTLIDGRCNLWFYGYQSPSKGEFNVVYLLGAIGVDTAWVDLPIDITKPLNFDSYKDSDVLSAVGETYGGSQFRSLYPLYSLSYAYIQSPLDTSRIYFHSLYNGVDTATGRSKILIVLIDPVTGMLVGAITKVEKDATAGIPTNFALYQNYPNPFNPTTTITYDLPLRANVKLVVYNVLGQKIAILVDEVQEPGRYNVTFDASNLPSGVYFYRLEADKFVQTKKMLLVK